MDVFRPTEAWGPGDKSQKKLWLEKKRSKRKISLNISQQHTPAIVIFYFRNSARL